MAFMTGRPGRTAAGAVLGLLGIGALARGQVIVKVNDDVNFRFGVLLQGWADWTQDANSEGYSQNLFLRRIRLLTVASVTKDVGLLYQTDNSRLGNAGTNGAKVINTGFTTLDAFAEWMVAGPSLMLDAGLFIVPSSRDSLSRSSNDLAFDISPFSASGNVSEQGNATRDYGAGVHGYLSGERLEYRLAAFSGIRQSAAQAEPPGSAGSRNPYRVAGRLNYDFLDMEHADTMPSRYVYAGTNLGARKVIAVGAWGDGQGNYKAFGGDFMFDLPIGRNAVTLTGDYDHFEQIAPNPALPKQNDVVVEGGYYFDTVKLQPFFEYQKVNYSEEARKNANSQRYGGGFNFYISGNNSKLSVLYERVVPATKPSTALTKDTNRLAIQLQAYYF